MRWRRVKPVREFLEGHNLKVVRVGHNNSFVRARGTVGDVESAFHVVLNNYQVRGKVIRANDRDPYIDGAAAPLVRGVEGLDTGEYEHPLMARTTLPGQKYGAARFGTANTVASDDAFFTTNCFNGTETDVFSNNNNGSLPIATYKGNVLNLQSLTSAGCAYTPPPIQTAYNLTGLYAEGYNGKGQTIGIIDWCGSLTIQSDANAFSATFGLPALTSSNFAITYIPTPVSASPPTRSKSISTSNGHTPLLQAPTSTSSFRPPRPSSTWMTRSSRRSLTGWPTSSRAVTAHPNRKPRRAFSIPKT
ncbi:MAG: protease pro-enzyme activation domain-containing protein [Candidatus Sulfotelmatobacter sp.]